MRKLSLIFLFIFSCVVPRKDLLIGCERGNSLLAVWVWDPGVIYRDRDSFEKVVREWGIKRVYLAGRGEVLKKAIAIIRDMGLEVYLTHSGKSLEGNFEPQLAMQMGYDGYQIDLEPYWDMSIQRFKHYAGEYLTVIRRLGNKTRNIPFSVVIPHWFDKVEVGSKSLAEEVFDLADEVVVMAYRDDLRESLLLAREEILLGIKKGKKVFIGLEATAYPESDTVPLSLRDLWRIGGMKCRGVEGFVINSLDALL